MPQHPSKPRVFIDACILLPITSCNTLLKLAEAALFTPLWSQETVNEAVKNIPKVNPSLDPQTVSRRFDFMNAAFPDAMVSGWERRTEDFALPDPGDHHILLAALHGDADLILTNNLKDFPASTLNRFGIDAVSLDNFLLGLLESDSATVLKTLQNQVNNYKRPPITLPELLSALSRCGAPRFTKEVTFLSKRAVQAEC